MPSDRHFCNVLAAIFASLHGARDVKVVVESTFDLRVYQESVRALSREHQMELPAPRHLPARVVETLTYRSPDTFTKEVRTEDGDDVVVRRSEVTATLSRWDVEDGRLEMPHDENAHFARIPHCRQKEVRGLPVTPATLEALDEWILNPIELLWSCKLDVIATGTRIGREAIGLRSEALCPAVRKWSSPANDDFSLGSHQEWWIDTESGIVLDRTVFLQERVAARHRVLSLRYITG